MGECGVIFRVVEPIKSFVFDAIIEYVRYIGSCEENLDALHKSLSEVCNKKDDIKKKVKLGDDKLEEISTEALSWLYDVQMLAEEEIMKELMYRDINTAKFVVKIMGEKVLKKRISKESEMQEVVVKVMKRLKEDMENCEEEEMRKLREADYKHMAEVVVEVMKNTFDDIKKLMKEDKNMAVIAVRSLKGEDIDKLIKDDLEMEEIVREAVNASDEEQWWNHDDEESNAPQPLLAKVPAEDVGNNNKVKEAAKKLFTPLANLITPLGKLMDDANFKKDVPEAGGVKLGLEVIDGLLIRGRGLNREMGDSTKQHRGCCCSFSLCDDYHGRYEMSKKAEFLVKHIQDDLISKYPRDSVTMRKRTRDLKPIPTQFCKGLVSRNKILDQILKSLNNDQVDMVGVFGMGGAGKTTLAKEVIKKVKDAFAIKVMVEVSDAPDFVRIQAAIAESIDLPLHDIHDVAQRAIRLYNRLKELKKEKQILIILDNVWKELNLDEIGIPYTCKLLLTTREREVCSVMNVRDVNILEVGLMDTNEAKELFKSLTGNQVDVREYRNVIERLLRKCGGLPLAIVATANLLKDKDLSTWENLADDLEKPILSQISGDYHHTFSILNKSYKFIQAKEKRIFFLLVCLSPLGSSASIESLMRYGMGLNLFEHVNKLSEAMKRANTWASELIMSSMLLEGDVKGDVKIHDLVRDFAISYATKGIPRWLDDETLKKYTAMSLTSKNDYSRLCAVEACKLQILILKGDLSPNFDDIFFNGMVNLEVLAFSNMKFQPSLPESMRNLKKLRTLCMEGCKLKDIELVGDLVNLLVLSLRESFVENLPNEIGNLCKLRLLDLSGCTSSKLPLISNGILSKLSRLEGLYLYNNRPSVSGMKSDIEEANDIENNSLPYLNALEIKVAVTEELPIDCQFISRLDKFIISVGSGEISHETLKNFCCILNLEDIDYGNEFLKKNWVKVLLKKADFLEMKCSHTFKHLVPQLDQDGFKSLRSLSLSACGSAKCIVDGRAMNNLIAFPCLQSLTLKGLWSLKMVCNGEVSPGSFSKLQSLKLFSMHNLLCGLPLIPRNINEIIVSSCILLKFVFNEDEVLPTELPSLKTLQLRNVPRLLSLVGSKKLSNTNDPLQGPQSFFDGKLVLPSLDLLELDGCDDVVELWSKEISAPGFQNLKDIKIIGCKKLSSVGSISVFSILVQLETLSVKECEEMRQLISAEETNNSEIGEQIIRFPQLKYLELGYLKNLESFYEGASKLEFPELQTLILDTLGSMRNFARNTSALFDEKIDFSRLEELRVISLNDEVMGLWDKQSMNATSNPAPMLRQLTLGRSPGLRYIPSVILRNLSSLTLSHFQDNDVVFSSSDSGEKEGFVWIYSELPNLEELKVEGSQSLKELFKKENSNAIDDALTLFCGQVKTLELNTLPSLNTIPLHRFKSVVSLTLLELKWNYLISAHVLEDSLHHLQFLTVDSCQNMEALVVNVGSHIELPKLKRLCLLRLPCFVGISSTPEKEAALLLPSLESLVIEFCHNIEHFWSGSIMVPRLQDLSLNRCYNLRHVLVGNIEDTIKLPSLQKVSFQHCPKIKSISPGSLTTPKLRAVNLWACDDMEYFFPGNQDQDGDLQLPFLEIVEIGYCSNLHAFSLRRVLSPKCAQVRYQEEEYSMMPYDDLNHFLEKINPISDSEDQEDLYEDDEGSGFTDGGEGRADICLIKDSQPVDNLLDGWMQALKRLGKE
ncbi:hypothetical protein KSS87_018509 [Heliosperma pusillum]|nr:hypothetical protein KSS87_018509 [Heliosperma pusillum]